MSSFDGKETGPRARLREAVEHRAEGQTEVELGGDGSMEGRVGGGGGGRWSGRRA